MLRRDFLKSTLAALAAILVPLPLKRIAPDQPTYGVRHWYYRFGDVESFEHVRQVAVPATTTLASGEVVALNVMVPVRVENEKRLLDTPDIYIQRWPATMRPLHKNGDVICTLMDDKGNRFIDTTIMRHLGMLGGVPA